MQEAEIITKYFLQQPHNRTDVTLGVGDDAAIITPAVGRAIVSTTDTLVAGIHFPHYTLAEDIGYKTAAVNFSDLAAMAAIPCWVSLSLTLPQAEAAWLQAFVSGFYQLLQQYNVALIGGDLCHGKELNISCHALGQVQVGKELRRDGAKDGDGIFVSGTLGDAGLGLQQFKPYSNYKITSVAQQKLLRPTPRVTLGQQLATIATAAIDISDGLLRDLQHILTKSRMGAIVDATAVPLSDYLKQQLAADDAVKLALTAGDDYELCFTAPLSYQQQLEALGCSKIGVITNSNTLQLEGAPIELLRASGYEHF